jgi:phosphate acetyltransferase
VQQDLPIALTDLGTFTTAERLMRVRGPITKESSRKIETARRGFAEQVDQAALLAAINVSASDVRTPLMFEYQLMERARADRQRIVLPESDDDRILEAAGHFAPSRCREPDLARRRDQGPRSGVGTWS